MKHLLGEKANESTAAGTELKNGMWAVRRSLEALSLKIEAQCRENVILQNIFFPSMNLREDAIHDPEEGTYKWILEEDNKELKEDKENDGKDNGRRADKRTIFLTWLRSGGGVFHISGKAGSGKSTLMKFLGHHCRTKEELGKWATGKRKKLVFAKFYFWNSSDDMQMSLGGLYRSILFETLKRCPDLIPVIFPVHWDLLANGVNNITGNLFNGPEIEKAFQKLVVHGTFPDHCFCFFIDGLDEYNGESWSHVQLAKSLQQWVSNGDVKVCASSRPYLEFDTLAGSPEQKFHLHELTRNDIYLFSRQMIEKDDNFNQIKDSYLQLVKKIVDMSRGVFLWARLAVFSLLAGMLRHDTIETLEEKLMVIPKDISKLYDSMFDSLWPDDQKRAAKMLLLTAFNPFQYVPLDCRVYGWIDKLDDPKFPPCDGRKPPSWQPARSMAEDVQRQLKSLTKGLLEPLPIKNWRQMNGELSETFAHMHAVRFFHRTVIDFVVESSRLMNMLLRHPRLIDEKSYYRLLLADLTLGNITYRYHFWNQFIIPEVIYGRIFHHRLPLNLLDGFCCVLNDGNYNSHAFNGLAASVRRMPYKVLECRSMSFVHMAAFAGHREYVLREVSERPKLLKGDRERHLLFSAALKGHQGLVAALIKKGSSPTDHIILQSEQTGVEPAGLPSIPVWLAVVVCMVDQGCAFRGMIFPEEKDPFFNISFDLLELFLDAEGVDARNCAFLLQKGFRDPPSHFITLEGFIDTFKPKNKERLLSLINKGKRHSYFEGVRYFMSQHTPFFQQVDGVAPSLTSEYTPFLSNSEDGLMSVNTILCGDLKLDNFFVQVF